MAERWLSGRLTDRLVEQSYRFMSWCPYLWAMGHLPKDYFLDTSVRKELREGEELG